MSNIKVYVSHRIDQNNICVDNEIFRPIRCGACFDESEQTTIQGDDTGDNISKYRLNLGELTVQYWAWKNTDSDYYGLCHYRRYLSFSDDKYPTDEKNQVIEDYLDSSSIMKYNLNDVNKIKTDIEGYDIIVPEYADISKMFTPLGPQGSIYQHFCAYNNYLVNKEDIDNLIIIITELYPELIVDMHEYLSGNKFLGYNCFILKKEIFDNLSLMEYTILNEFKKRGLIDLSTRTSLQQRTYGFICEWIFGIYIYHLEKTSKCKILKKQLVFFNNCSKISVVNQNQSKIPLVYVTGHYHLPFTQTSLYSAFVNKNKDTLYEPIIFHNELSKDEIDTMKNYFNSKFNVSILFVDIKNYEVDGKHLSDPRKIVAFLPWILINYPKSIILHSDTVIQSDLGELYNYSSNKAIYAPIDSIRVAQCRKNNAMYETLKKQLNLSADHLFFSTNAAVFNLELMRAENYHEFIIETYNKNYSCKDMLNSVFTNSCEIVDSKWNKSVSLNQEGTFLFDYLPKKYVSNEINSGITHFVSYPKLCDQPFDTKGSLFWTYARNIPTYEHLLMHAAYSIISKTNSSAPEVQKKKPIKYKIFPPGTVRYELALKILHHFKRD